MIDEEGAKGDLPENKVENVKQTPSDAEVGYSLPNFVSVSKA